MIRQSKKNKNMINKNNVNNEAILTNSCFRHWFHQVRGWSVFFVTSLSEGFLDIGQVHNFFCLGWLIASWILRGFVDVHVFIWWNIRLWLWIFCEENEKGRKVQSLERIKYQFFSFLQSRQLRCWQKDGKVRCISKRIGSEEEYQRPL